MKTIVWNCDKCGKIVDKLFDIHFNITIDPKGDWSFGYPQKFTNVGFCKDCMDDFEDSLRDS